MALLALVSALLALLVLPFALYLGLLALFAQKPPPTLFAPPSTRFVIVVPAHNEAASIANTLRNLRGIEYPKELFSICVIADNCTDDTAHIAKKAGAMVVVRNNPELRGKGYALELAFEQLLTNSEIDAFVVVDADTTVTPNILREFGGRLAFGARAVQAEYGVQNSEASWRTRLLTVALAMFHRTRSLAREHWGVSCGLRGNGMCFSREILLKHPHRAYGLVEDVEYGVLLGLAGERVAYASNAMVFGEMVSSGAGAKSQRHRWEQGRKDLRRTLFPKTLHAAFAQRSLMLFDLAFDLLVPPLSTVACLIGLGLTIEIATYVVFGFFSPGLYLWLMSSVCLFLYGARGIQHSGLGWRAITALAYVPLYIGWKLLRVRPTHSQEWIRTRREAEAESE